MKNKGTLLISASKVHINMAALEPVKRRETKEINIIAEYGGDFRNPNDGKGGKE